MALEGTQASTTGRWHLIAQKGDLTALVYPGMRLGEDAAGRFTLSPADPLIELGVEHDLLTVRVLTAPDGPDGKTPPPLYVNADTRVRVNLPHDQFIIDPAWATGQHRADVIDIQVQPRTAAADSKPVPLQAPAAGGASVNAEQGPPPPRWMNEREYGVLVAIGMLVMIFLLYSWNQPAQDEAVEAQVAAVDAGDSVAIVPAEEDVASVEAVAVDAAPAPLAAASDAGENDIAASAALEEVALDTEAVEVQPAALADEPVTQPVAAETAATEPVVSDPVVIEPVVAEPIVADTQAVEFTPVVETEPASRTFPQAEVIEEPALVLESQSQPAVDDDVAEATQNVAVVSSLVTAPRRETPPPVTADESPALSAVTGESVVLENPVTLPTDLPANNETFGSEVADVVPLLDALPLTADAEADTPAAVTDLDEAGLLTSAEAVDTAVITDEAPFESTITTPILVDQTVEPGDYSQLTADVAAIDDPLLTEAAPTGPVTEPVEQPLLAALTEPTPLIADESDFIGPLDNTQQGPTLDAAPVVEATPEPEVTPTAETIEDTLYPYGDLKVVRQRAPVYPRRAPDGASGFVDVEFTVNEEGRVELVEVRGNPPDYFARAAISAVRRWRFEAVRVDGQPVAVRTMLRLTFQG